MSEEKNIEEVEEVEATETQDTEGQAFRSGRRMGDGHLPRGERDATDDGSDDTEGQAARAGR